jgi:hypothetical protein
VASEGSFRSFVIPDYILDSYCYDYEVVCLLSSCVLKESPDYNGQMHCFTSCVLWLQSLISHCKFEGA